MESISNFDTILLTFCCSIKPHYRKYSLLKRRYMRIEECFSANHKNCRYNLYNNDRFTWANIHRKSVFISLPQFLCVFTSKKETRKSYTNIVKKAHRI